MKHQKIESMFYGVEHRFGWFESKVCDDILKLAGEFPSANDAFSYGAVGVRNSKTFVIDRDDHSSWLYDLMWEITHLLNGRFQFDIVALEEPLQLIRYEKSERVDWHIDCGGPLNNGGKRKVSLSVQLSGSDDYVGGDLEFASNTMHPFARSRGSVIGFPSFLAHRITPVASGVRFALVAFVEGAPFR